MDEWMTEEADHSAEARTLKNNYSIWSLLVIMTVLAVLLAMPKPTRDFGPLIHALLVGSHQIALWILFGRLIWLLLGKRRSVLIIELIIVLVVWGPLFGVIAEDLLSGKGNHPTVRNLLNAVGLFDAYGELYKWIFNTFGYGSL